MWGAGTAVQDHFFVLQAVPCQLGLSLWWAFLVPEGRMATLSLPGESLKDK